jgi:hypothetical protein
VPVAAVAEIVAVSKIFEVFRSALDDVPAKVCKPVNEFATLVTGIFAAARLVATVPPLAVLTGNVRAATDELANKVTTLELFLKYSFPSAVLIANSPATRLPAVGRVEAVVE